MIIVNEIPQKVKLNMKSYLCMYIEMQQRKLVSYCIVEAFIKFCIPHQIKEWHHQRGPLLKEVKSFEIVKIVFEMHGC